jgi:hypothetical protein
MKTHKVTLVVPQSYHKAFPNDYRNELLSLKEFIDIVRNKQS